MDKEKSQDALDPKEGGVPWTLHLGPGICATLKHLDLKRKHVVTQQS